MSIEAYHFGSPKTRSKSRAKATFVTNKTHNHKLPCVCVLCLSPTSHNMRTNKRTITKNKSRWYTTEHCAAVCGVVTVWCAYPLGGRAGTLQSIQSVAVGGCQKNGAALHECCTRQPETPGLGVISCAPRVELLEEVELLLRLGPSVVAVSPTCAVSTHRSRLNRGRGCQCGPSA